MEANAPADSVRAMPEKGARCTYSSGYFDDVLIHSRKEVSGVPVIDDKGSNINSESVHLLAASHGSAKVTEKTSDKTSNEQVKNSSANNENSNKTGIQQECENGYCPFGRKLNRKISRFKILRIRTTREIPRNMVPRSIVGRKNPGGNSRTSSLLNLVV
jgi:hypothetical protein